MKICRCSSTKMKIAVLHRYPPDQVTGTNASFLDFLYKLSKNNKVYYLTYKSTKKGAKFISSVEYVHLPFSFNRGYVIDKIIKTWLWIFLSPLYVKYLQINHKIDLVYCDDSVPIYGFLIKLFCPSIKVVIRLGDLQTAYSLWDNHKTLFDFSQKIESFMWKKMDGIVSISKPFGEYIVKMGVKSSSVFVVEESINLDKKINPVITDSNQSINLLFHGALLKCKGVEVLLKAFKELQQKDKKIKLTIAGGGEEEGYLKQIVKNQSIEGVNFTGWYDHKILEKIMEEVDIGIVMRNGNFGNNFVVTTCLLENWKFKVPVIVPKLKTFEMVIKDGVNGVFFEPDNVIDLSEKIIFLIKNKERWSKMGHRGYDTAKLLFSHKKIATKMVETLVKIYEK